VPRGNVRARDPALPGQSIVLLRCHDGGARGMIDYLGAAVLFVFIVAVLIVLWRREHR
jgi:hypothetical protein